MTNEAYYREIEERIERAKASLKEPYVALIGVGMGDQEMLTGEAKTVLKHADVVVGAFRILEGIIEPEQPCIMEYRPDAIVEEIKAHPEYKAWAVVLSGDTGFYSGAKKLFARLRQENIRVSCIPGIASVVYLAAKLGTSWEEAALRSIHGREQNIIYAIDHNRKTFVLMDKKSAIRFCEKVVYYRLKDIDCYIGNNLSYKNERIITKRGTDLTPDDFGELSTVMVINEKSKHRASPHLRDEEFLRMVGDIKIPMTKEEVRAVTMAKLGLTTDSVFFDIGAGTGSIAVEAAMHGENIRVYAIEHKEEACKLVERNKRRFRADQITIVHGRAPEALEGLEKPTHVFIGGTAGQMTEIIKAVKNMNPEVTIVINAIAMETLGEIIEAVNEGLLVEPEMVQVIVSKSRSLGDYHMMSGQNPIYIITERK